MPRNYTNGKSDKALIGHIGFDGPVKADTSQTKRILITGAGSYICLLYTSDAADEL